MKTHQVIMFAMCAVSIAGCGVPVQKAKNTLEANGYHDVALGGIGWPFNGCSKGDRLARSFVATAANGSTVKGWVCSGWGFWGTKGVTVRITNVKANPLPTNGGLMVEPPHDGDYVMLCAAYVKSRPEQSLKFMDEYCKVS